MCGSLLLNLHLFALALSNLVYLYHLKNLKLFSFSAKILRLRLLTNTCC